MSTISIGIKEFEETYKVYNASKCGVFESPCFMNLMLLSMNNLHSGLLNITINNFCLIYTV
jgi:hypothetical protein